jgi:hypothetical protein
MRVHARVHACALLPILVLSQVIAGALGPGALSCILRAAGVMRAPAAINALAFWAAGIPVGIALAFSPPVGVGGWGVAGLAVGVNVSNWVMVAATGWLLLCTMDYDAVASEVADRAQARRRERRKEGQSEE